MPATLSTTPLDDDSALLRGIAAGADGAFEAFVERYGRRLFAFGLRMCGQRQDAEDVFQDTLLKAYQGLERLRDPAAVRTWLFRVASNQCLMTRRKTAGREALSLEEFKPEGWDEGAMREIADWSALPEDAARQAELRRELERALTALPADFKVVVLLREVEGLSTRETAEVLDLGEGAVKMRLHRARLALRQHLADYHREVSGGAGGGDG